MYVDKKIVEKIASLKHEAFKIKMRKTSEGNRFFSHKIKLIKKEIARIMTSINSEKKNGI